MRWEIMRKILSSLAGLTLIISTTSGTVVACGATTSQATKESNQLNNKTITLNDTASATYESKTAQADTTAIDDAIVKAGYLNASQVKDLSFDNISILNIGQNPNIKYSVKSSDGSTASGTLNVTINPYKPTPPPPPPTPSTAKQEADKVNQESITLNNTASVKYDKKTAQQDIQAIDDAIVADKYLNATQVKDFSFDNTNKLKLGANNNVGFTVKNKDGSTAKGVLNIYIQKYTPPPPPTPSSETAQAIADKITNKTIWMNSNLGGSTSNPYTAQSILGLLKSINSDNIADNSKNLTTRETQSISLADATLTNQLQTVNATIHGAKGTTADVPLQIGLNPKTPAGAHSAPFFDMGQLYHYNLNSLLSNNSINTITAAFLQHVAGKDVPTADDPVGWSWAGVSIDQNPKAQEQYTDLMNYKKAGGSYYISFGGQAGTPGWASQFGYSEAEIQKSLQYVIDLYQPAGLDFDVEGSAQNDTAGNTKLFQAVANLAKANPNLQFSYTIAVAPQASADALNPNFEASFDNMLNLPYAPTLNLMTMDYATAEPNMYDPSVQCAQMLNKKVLADNKWGLKTAAEVNQHMSLTPMIGQNDSNGEVTTKNDMMKLAHYEAINQMARMSDWSLTRDNNSAAGSSHATYSGSGEYQDPYEFSNIILNTFGDSSQSNKPVAGSLTASNFAVFQDAITIDWKGATNVNYYNVYVDGSPVAKVNGQATGYAYYDPKLAQKPHQVKVVAVGAQGSSITSNTFTVDPSKSKLSQPLIEYDPTATYPKPTYVYYQGQVGRIKYWKGPGPMQPYQFQAMGKLSDYTNSLSPTAIADFTNNTMPNWYFNSNPAN